MLWFYSRGFFFLRVNLPITVFSFDNYLKVLIVRQASLWSEDFGWLINRKWCICCSASHLLAEIFDNLNSRRGRGSLLKRSCWRWLKKDHFRVDNLFCIMGTDREGVRDTWRFWYLSFIKHRLIIIRCLSLLFFNFLNISLRKAMLHLGLIVNFNHCHKEHYRRSFAEGSACFSKTHFISLSLRNGVCKYSSDPRMLYCLRCMVTLT